MELDLLKKVIADVLNVDPDEITEDTTFVERRKPRRSRPSAMPSNSSKKPRASEFPEAVLAYFHMYDFLRSL